MICRDAFGIPHIFASTLVEAAYAVNYAQAEDRLEELVKNYRRDSGTMAEVFGAGCSTRICASPSCAMPRSAGLATTRSVPGMAGVIEAYQGGLKQFMKEHPEQVPAWAPSIEPWNVIAMGRYIIWNWPMGEAAADLKRVGVELGPLSYRGSNELMKSSPRRKRCRCRLRPGLVRCWNDSRPFALVLVRDGRGAEEEIVLKVLALLLVVSLISPRFALAGEPPPAVGRRSPTSASKTFIAGPGRWPTSRTRRPTRSCSSTPSARWSPSTSPRLPNCTDSTRHRGCSSWQSTQAPRTRSSAYRRSLRNGTSRSPYSRISSSK